MNLDKTIWREALAHYRAWNECEFVEQVLSAGQKTPGQKWREYRNLYVFGRRIKADPSEWEENQTAEVWAEYYERIMNFERWRRLRGRSA